MRFQHHRNHPTAFQVGTRPVTGERSSNDTIRRNDAAYSQDKGVWVGVDWSLNDYQIARLVGRSASNVRAYRLTHFKPDAAPENVKRGRPRKQ